MTDPDGPTPGQEPDPEIVLRSITDWPGLIAYAPLPASGRYPRNRSGVPYYRTIRLRTDDPVQPPHRPNGLLSDTDWAWMIRSEHGWKQITDRFGDRAHIIAFTLARAGCITIGYELQGARPAPTPKKVYPHPALTATEKDRRTSRRDQRTNLQTRAAALAADMAGEWPGVAHALISTDHADRLTWAVNAATDLATGAVHPSVRAFVQHHAANTKARDDVQRLLADLGFEPAALAEIGLSRSPYIGVAGPVRLHPPTGPVIDLSGLPGPHDLRLHPTHPLTITVTASTGPLLIIENRQAAEAVCDTHPHLPIIWCHGQPPDPVLDLIRQTAAQVQLTWICTDADLGGVRITARIHDNLPPATAIRVIDVGTAEHTSGKPFSTYVRTRLEPVAARGDQVGAFARACLARGYVVEQEASTRTALVMALDSR
ncbi:hypothetical protein GCM10011608_11340 [Micromonospora sonchi]|uniref:DUF2399 domain-containing protein n=1 Tax=Micromonospora sonchi TaxID=1763543 RepID=A0A917TMD5_9ACTN|nr:DUF2399 domain-containing protein [Micromonospora sonchi]GGM28250.1 hypothetical protein GCM10011608_11340 [Micromonospora sonchi]